MLINLGRSQHGSPCLVWQCRGHLCWHIQCVFQCCSKLVMVLFSFRLLYSCTNTHTQPLLFQELWHSGFLVPERNTVNRRQWIILMTFTDLFWVPLSGQSDAQYIECSCWHYWILYLPSYRIQVQCTGAQIYHRSPPNKQNLECKQAQV